ncbi:SdiA-regulated domain-containing protein [Daejeonella sp.]|uniref:SdiA-regulated domain-containing protein n=1 Tax=Daejeonella sp. TaxID=2805397 RepID=UPI0030C2FC37
MIRNTTLLIIIALASCNTPTGSGNTDADQPNSKVIFPTKNLVHELPPELSEISGITFLSDTVLVAIQDEEGILYYYDLQQNKVIKKQTFAGSGDYEDLTRVGKDIFVITSAGVLTLIRNFESTSPVVSTIATPFTKKNDIEGMAYDSKNHRLLIAPKEHGLDQNKTTKQIYGFDLKTMQFQPEPAFAIRLDEISSQFEGDALEESSKKFLKAIGNEGMNKVFRSSAITVNEKTGEIFVLSSLNGLIIILSPKGVMNQIIQFSGVEYKQPEGIAFAPNGKLYISNEGSKSGIGNIIEITHER